MKPLIIFEVPYCEPEEAKRFDDHIAKETQKNGTLEGYDAIVVYGDIRARVYYPCKPITFYFHKLRIWLLRKIKIL